MITEESVCSSHQPAQCYPNIPRNVAALHHFTLDFVVRQQLVSR